MIIIAEAGINHNGNITIAKELIDAAKDSGADAVKFQTFWDIGRLEDYEFTMTQWLKIKKYCDKKNITFLTTPHSICAIDFVDRIVPFHKIASPHLKDKEFLQKVNGKGKPILLSTGSLDNDNGMATDEEIIQALSWLLDYIILNYKVQLEY